MLSDETTILAFMPSTDQKGAIAESAIVCAALKAGVGVWKPVSDGERYDLILDVNGRLLRVQCKWAPRRGDVLSVGRRTQIDLRLAAPKNNQVVGVNRAADFELMATLSRLAGAIAQLGERRHGMAEVTGSSPVGSTRLFGAT